MRPSKTDHQIRSFLLLLSWISFHQQLTCMKWYLPWAKVPSTVHFVSRIYANNVQYLYYVSASETWKNLFEYNNLHYSLMNSIKEFKVFWCQHKKTYIKTDEMILQITNLFPCQIKTFLHKTDWTKEINFINWYPFSIAQCSSSLVSWRSIKYCEYCQ